METIYIGCGLRVLLHFSSPLLPLLLLPSLPLLLLLFLFPSPFFPSLFFFFLFFVLVLFSLLLSSSFPPSPSQYIFGWAPRLRFRSQPSPSVCCVVLSILITSLAWSDLTGNIKRLNSFVQGGSVFISVLWLFSMSDTEEGLGNVWQSISLPIHEVTGHKDMRIHVYTHLHKWTWITKHHSSQEKIRCQGLRCRFWN